MHDGNGDKRAEVGGLGYEADYGNGESFGGC